MKRSKFFISDIENPSMIREYEISSAHIQEVEWKFKKLAAWLADFPTALPLNKSTVRRHIKIESKHSAILKIQPLEENSKLQDATVEVVAESEYETLINNVQTIAINTNVDAMTELDLIKSLEYTHGKSHKKLSTEINTLESGFDNPESQQDEKDIVLTLAADIIVEIQKEIHENRMVQMDLHKLETTDITEDAFNNECESQVKAVSELSITEESQPNLNKDTIASSKNSAFEVGCCENKTVRDFLEEINAPKSSDAAEYQSVKQGEEQGDDFESICSIKPRDIGTGVISRIYRSPFNLLKNLHSGKSIGLNIRPHALHVSAQIIGFGGSGNINIRNIARNLLSSKP
ncbi:hypothetical protein HK098_004611 [Nowakowskiella sp. JEL0407]|nr:hypothetical protein HK098_004611 [Nowakowskiella sp. JEL0407]